MTTQILSFISGHWAELVGWTIGVLGLVWRYKVWDQNRKDKAATAETRLAMIESRLNHLDDPLTGRVNKLSILTENQIETNKKSWALANYVKGRLDAKSNP